MKGFIKRIVDLFYQKVVSKLKLDDVLHAYISSLLFIVLFISLGFGMNIWLAYGISIAITILIGLFKEYIIDKKIRCGIADMRDFKADIFGCGLGMIIGLYIILFISKI